MTSTTDPRLETYTDAALAMESGKFDVEIPVTPPDQVGTLGVAIARLGHALEHKYEELRALRKVTEEVGSSLLIEEVCEHVYETFSELIPYHRLGLALLDEDGESVRAFWARPVGFFFFSSRELRAYEAPHVDLFLQIAANLSAVIEKSRLYEHLLELNGLKNRLLGMAAHDMRSPLTVISGWVDMLRSGYAGELSEQAIGVLGHIDGAANQMLRLVEDLLDVSVIEAGQLELDRQPLELSTHLADHLESARLLTAAKGIELVAELSAGSAWVDADANRLRQVLDNLLSNAIKFSPAGSTVSVRLEPRGSAWAISVQDHGKGIPKEERQSLFGAFERTSVRPTAGERSIGLGLAITRQVVDAHDGRIQVQSEVGEGSTFTVELPVRPMDG